MAALYALIVVSNILGVLSIPAALRSGRTPVAAFGFACGLIAMTSELTLVFLKA